jgi:hypothetical protein
VNIGIIDAEIIGKKKHRFPNLACMKISAYHKSIGNNVQLLLTYDDISKYDKVYISKVFTNTLINENILGLPNVEYGGTGFYYDKAPALPDEIEHIMPDYHLYDEWVAICLQNGVNKKSLQYYTDFSIGFATRGCFRGCEFCVNKNCKKSIKQGGVAEWVDESRPYICCLDDNVFACAEWREVFKELQATGKRFQFKQGCDERLLTGEKCEELFKKSKWIGDYIFAFDNYKDKDIIIEKLKLLRKYTNAKCKFYCFCGYNHDSQTYNNSFFAKDLYELFKRIEILMKYGCLPYIMRHENYEKSPYRGMYITIARWCNQPSFYKKMSFREFCVANGENSSAYRYMAEFEKLYPQFKNFFDMKFEEIKQFSGGV